MNRFDSALSARSQRKGLGARLRSFTATLLSLLVVGSLAASAQTLTHIGPTPPAGPFVAGEICAGNSPQFQIATTALPTVVYNAAGIAWPGLEAEVAANDIPIGVGAGFIGDDQVYQIPAAAINAAAGGAFNFDYYGETHDLGAQGLFLGTNGFVRFQDGNPNNDAAVEFFETGIAAQAIPAAGGPNGAIYFLNLDLAPQVGEDIDWEIQEVGGAGAGYNALVISFRGVSQYNPLLAYPYNQVDVQLIIYPNNHAGTPNQIEVRLANWPDPAVIPARNHTIGVENKCGNAATPANANHNQDPWANANGAGEVANYAVTFNPVNGAAQTFQARLVSTGTNLAPNTYSRTVIAGDDTYRSANTAGTTGTNLNITATNVLTTATVAGDREYYAVVEYQNCGIVITNEVSITVNPTPAVQSITGPTAVCVGTVYNYNVTLTNGNTYTWSTTNPGATVTPNVATLNQNSATINFATGSNAGTATTVTCVETTPAGCQTTHNILNVTVYSVPNGTISGPTPVCANSPGNVYSISGGPYGTYSWTITNAPPGTTPLSGTGSTINVTWGNLDQPNGAVVANINVTVSNGPGNLCPFTAAAFPVTVNPRPAAGKTVTSTDLTPCVNQTITYGISGGAVAGNSYSYTAAGGSFAYIAPGGYVNGTPTLGLASVQLQWTNAGGGRSMTINEITAAGCSRSVNLTGIVVEALPTPVITGPSLNVCGYVAPAAGNPSYSTVPSPREYTYAVAVANPLNTYAWTITGGTIVAVNNGTINTALTASGVNCTQITVRWNNPTEAADPVNQTINLTETSPNNCSGSAATFNVSTMHSATAGDFSLAGAGIGGAANPCANATGVVYTASEILADAVTHQFYVLSGGTLALTTPTTATVNWGNAATGSIRHEMTHTASGCTSFEDYTITIAPLPEGDISGLATVCGNAAGISYSVINVVNGPITHNWSLAVNPGAVATLTTPAADVTASLNFGNPAGTVVVTLQDIVTGPAPTNCTNTITFNITVNPTPAAPVITGANGGGTPEYVCAGTVEAYQVTGIAGGTTTISVTGGTASQTVFAGAGPHNFNVTWGFVPAGGAGNIQATITALNCPSAPTNLGVTVSPLPAVPVLEYSLDNITYSPNVPPLCVTNVPFYVRVNNTTAGINYSWSSTNPVVVASVVSDVGGGGNNELFTVNTFAAGNGTIQVTATDAVTGCQRPSGPQAITVAPVPTPVISGPTDACNYTTNPAGVNGSVLDADAVPFEYNYQTPYVAVNQYAWTVTNGYIVGYRVNATGPWTYINPVATTSGAPVLGANQIRVVFYGNTPGKVKVSEIAPGGCQFTTLDYNVNLNALPVVQVLTPSPSQDICSESGATVSIASSQVGYTYRVETSTNGGLTWTWASTAGTAPGTGAAVNFNIAASDLTYTATPPNVTTYDVRVTAQNTVGLLTCGWYPASNNTQIIVNPKPAANIPVVTNPDPLYICTGEVLTVVVGSNAIPSESWVSYQLQESPIGLNTWVNVGTPVVGNGIGSINLTTPAPAGGAPTLAADNYDYRVVATTDMSFAPPPNIACQTVLTQQETARVFALPIDPTVTFTPNPVCWEENVTVNLANTQNGVQYEVNIGGTSLSPVVIIDGNGGAANAIINSTEFQATNPVGLGSVNINNVQVTARIAIYGPFVRPIPPSTCATDFGTTTLTVLEKPTAAISGPDTVCGPSTTNFTAAPVTPAPISTFDWVIESIPDAPPAGTTPLVQNNTGNGTVNPFIVNWGTNQLSCNGTYNPLNVRIRMIATNNNGCTDTAYHNVTINPTVSDATVTGDPTACIYGGYEQHLETYVVARGSNCVFPAGTTYLWSLPPVGNPVSGAIRSGQNTTSIVAEWITTSGSGIGTVTCAITLPASHGGCTTIRTWDVNVYPLPQPVINGPANVCQGQTGVVYTADAYPNDTYLWEVLGGNIVSANGGTGVPGNLSFRTGTGLNVIAIDWINAANPNAFVRLTQTSIAGCMNKTTFNVTVHPTPVPVINGPGVVCNNSVVQYSTADNAPNNVYTWTAVGAIIQSGANQATMSVLTPAAGSFLITLNERVLATGCETTVQRTINVVTKPQPTITRNNPLPGQVGGACFGEEVEYGNTDVVAPTPSYSYQWTVSNGVINPLTPATGAIIKVTWNTVGTGTLTLAKWHTGSQCTTVVSQSVNITNKPQPAITGPNVVCGGDQFTYSTPFNAGNTYLWSVAGATLVSANNANNAIVKFTNPGTLASTNATISVTETNTLSGCSGSTSLVVTVNYMPQATVINGASTVCNNSTTNYNVSGEPVGLTYNWSVTGGTITSGAGTPSINVEWSSVGNQTVSVVLKNGATSCEKTLTRTVTVEFQPAPSISGDATVCTGEQIAYSTPANAGSTYVWAVTGGTIVSGNASPSIIVLWNIPGAQTVTVTETNASGNCIASRVLNVTVGQTPVATAITRLSPAGNVSQACENDIITYGTNISSGGPVTYEWTTTGGVFTSATNASTATVRWTAQGNQTLKVKITATGTDCSTTLTQNVTVTYKPAPNINGSVVACINKDHVYQTPYVAGSSYLWSITPANVFAPITGYPNSNVIEVKWIQPGLHTVTVTETNIAGGCATTVSMNVQVNLIPTPFITSTTGYGNPPGRRPGIVCNFSTHTYTTVATPGNTFIWTVTGGNITGGQYTNTISVAWGPAGIGTIAVQETIPGSDCITTKLDTIDIRPTPTPVITGTNINPCAGSVQTYSTPFVQGNSYYWDVPVGGTILSGQNSNQITIRWDANTAAVTWPNTQATSLKVTEWVTDVLPLAGRPAPYAAVTSCWGEDGQSITIRPIPPTPVISGSAVVCASDLSDDPQTVNIYTYSSSVPAQNASLQGTISYAWSTSSNGVIVGSTTGTSAQIWWSNTGNTQTNGTIFLTHTSSWGCSSSSTYSVTINPLPNPVIEGPASVCQNSLQTYKVTGVAGNTYSWAVTGGNIIRAGQNTPSVTVEWTLPGSYTLTVTETNTFGCTVLNNRYVTVNALPEANITASGSTTFCQGGDVTLSAPIGYASYVWSTGETSRSIVVRTTGQYWVKVTDANGCSNNSDTITVNVFPNTLPIITVSGPTTFCEGGSVTLTAPAGFSAYLWSTGATTQSITVTESGSYTVTIADGNGCTGTSTEVDVFVNPKPAPILTVVGATTICAGDSVEVRAPAGYVSYTWVSEQGVNYGTTRSIWVLQSDKIYVQVVDANGCVGESDTVEITVAPVVAPVIAPNGPTTFCDGNSVKLSAPEGFATYYWSNGATTREIVVADGGNYTVTVTNNAACESVSAPTEVVVNPLPARPGITRTGDTLKAVSMEAETFQWFRNGVMIPGAVDRNLVVSLPGTYRVEIADNNICSAKSDGFDVILTDVDEDVVAGHGAELRLFPNPTTGQFTIETVLADAGNVKIELVNTVGEVVLTLNEITNGGTFSANVDMGTLASGVYNVVVTTGNERWTVRLVRQ